MALVSHIPGKSIIREFEYKLSDYFSMPHCIATCNASISIYAVFKSLGIENSEVITTPLTWPGAITGLIWNNNYPIFCDIEESTFTISPDLIEQKITSKTKAVFTADFQGYPARLDKIAAICKKNNLLLIHDAASSFGSAYKSKPSGYFADITIVSFGQKKLFSLGEAGAILVNTDTHYHLIAENILHPENQSLIKENINPFFLNISINPLAAQYGVNNFDRALFSIKEKAKQIENILFSEFGIKQKINISPNYHSVLLKDTLGNNKDIGNKLLNDYCLIDIEKKDFAGQFPVLRNVLNSYGAIKPKCLYKLSC